MLNWKRELQAAKVRKEDMNKLVMNFLASEAWTRAVEEFRVESGTNTDIDLATVTDRMEVKKAVQTGCIADAVEKVNNIDPEIFNKNPRALFILHIQFFIELLRDGNVEKMVEAMTFAQDKLAPMAEKNGFLEDFERAFSLLVLGKGSGSPFRHLLRTSQRFETAIDVNEAILISHKNEKAVHVEGGMRRGWGTWEELILGGAVVRHGTQDWNVVALELRSRSICSFAITPEVCKSKYEDLLKRYSGSRAWFEELRKQRVAELKLELARSEDSIGSLKSKIKTLEAEKQHCDQAEYSSSQTESARRSLDSNGTESTGKEASKDGFSAGSFTRDTRINPDTSISSKQDRDVVFNKITKPSYGQGVTVRKRRGQRKRKDCSQAAKDTSVGESEILGSSDIVSTAQKEVPINDIDRISKDLNKMDTTSKDSYSAMEENLIEIFDSIAQTEPASVFRHRMDSQKRARYRKIIRQHVDISTIRSRILKSSIKSVKELFSDLLLLANNALVFYSRRTREYKSACSLRDLVKREYRKHCMGSSQESVSCFLACHPPVKPRSARPRPPLCKDRVLALSGKLSKAKNVTLSSPKTRQKPNDADTNVLLQTFLKDSKVSKRPGKLNLDQLTH
ncbi:hypothetical protein F511_03037 [Dorcoceras hygrometricum]|nr:hypothetical protein F511_03037 [Dorcoceras hygrometricum]